jgi:pimeloyl-ACP methyl ester carboxylesterase/DNA-binding SARP family transcriptional activator
MTRIQRNVASGPFAEALAVARGPRLCLLGTPALFARKRFSALKLRPKAVALVAYLALAGVEVSRRELARLLFPEAEEPLGVLRWHLAHVRTAAPPFVARCLRATRDGVALVIPTDVEFFRAGMRLVSRHPEAPGAARALGFYRGDLVAGLSVSGSAEFDNWLYVAQEHARRDFRRGTLAFAHWAIDHRAARQALEPLARLVTVDPYCEDGHVMLIEAYDALKDVERAAKAYERYQRIVRRELAAEPQPSLVLRFEGRPPMRAALPREEFIPLHEVTLHTVDWEGGEPTVLGIHGSAGMAHTFGALAERLAPTVRFVGVDLRGHGFSDKPPAGYDLERHVEDVRQLITELGLRHPILLGHSAGGTIAAFVASTTDVAGLVLLEAMIGDRAFTENAAAQAAPLATTLGSRVAGFDAYLAEWRTRREPFSDDAERLLDRWVRFALAPLPCGEYRVRALRAAVEAEWDSIIAADSLAALGRVRCPVLIVQALKPWLGGRPYFSRRIVEAQLRAAPNAEVFVAEHSDHAALVRDPAPSMVSAILAFVSRSAAVAGVASAPVRVLPTVRRARGRGCGRIRQQRPAG